MTIAPTDRRTPRPGGPTGGSNSRTPLALAALGIAIIAGSGAYAVALSPVELARTELARFAAEQWHRELKIGDGRIASWLPQPKIEFRALSLSAPSGMSAPPTLKAERLTVAVDLLALLRRDVVIESFEIDRPELDLRIDREGHASWDGGASKAAKTSAASPASVGTLPGAASGSGGGPQPAQPAGASAAPASGDLVLKSALLHGGRITLMDERTGRHQEVASVEVESTLDGLARPLKVVGEGTLNGQKLRLAVSADHVVGLDMGVPVHMAATLKSATLSASFEGETAAGPTPSARGRIAVSADRWSDIAALIGNDIAAPSASVPIKLTADLASDGKTTDLTNAVLNLGEAKAAGTLTIVAKAPRPSIQGEFKVETLDADRLIADLSGGGTPSPVATPVGAARPPAAAASSGPIGSGAPPAALPTGSVGQKIDVRFLGAADVHLTAAIGTLTARGFRLGPAYVQASVADEVARVELVKAAAYGGSVRGRLDVDARKRDDPAIGFAVDAEGVDGQAIMAAATNGRWLSGRLNLSATGTSHGADTAALVGTLSGRAESKVSGGKLIGLDVAKSLRSLAQGNLGGIAPAAGDETAFSQATASFAIDKGVATTKDLTLVSPAARVAGAGSANLANRRLDLVLKPHLTPGADAPATLALLANVEVPLHIRGEWDRPEIGIDVAGALKKPDQILGVVKALGQQLGSGDTQAAINGALSRWGVGTTKEPKPVPPKPTRPPPDAHPKFDPKALLDSLNDQQ